MSKVSEIDSLKRHKGDKLNETLYIQALDQSSAYINMDISEFTPMRYLNSEKSRCVIRNTSCIVVVGG